jgi:hypothetical protein
LFSHDKKGRTDKPFVDGIYCGHDMDPQDFAAAFMKLEELGVPFKEGVQPIVFKRLL